MQALVYRAYGPPDKLELQEADIPALGKDEVLVHVHAASVNWLDWHFLTGRPLLALFLAGLFKPRNSVLGIDMAGQVTAVGPDVTQFRPGDAVFGTTEGGCFAEYVLSKEAASAAKPANIGFEEAAAVPAAGATALHALRDCGHVRKGQRVLINGASGGVGSFAVQIARFLGAKVTGVCSTGNLDLVGSLGAERVIDYSCEDFARTEEANDLIVGVAGKRPFATCRQALKSQRTCVTTENLPTLVLRSAWVSRFGEQKMVPLPAKRRSERT